MIQKYKKNKNKIYTTSFETQYKAKARGLFEIVVAVVVQSVFRLEMHQDDIFLFFKNYF
jgi:hypothetical protein